MKFTWIKRVKYYTFTLAVVVGICVTSVNANLGQIGEPDRFNSTEKRSSIRTPQNLEFWTDIPSHEISK